MNRLPVVLAALLAASPTPAAPRADVAEVVAAERAFAQAARTEGVNAAFLRFSAPDALLFQPGPVPAKAALAASPLPAITLDWRPAFAGISTAGDLGFTTGPFVVGEGERRGHGWYFTIWKRQPDGRWLWILDHGPRTREPAPNGTGARVAILPGGRPSRGARAFAAVKAADAALNAGLASDARSALPRFLAADGRMMRVGPQPGVGAAGWAPLLESGPDRLDGETLGVSASSAGDLAFTWGRARWHKGEARMLGHYVRLWQHRREGWSLIVDNLVAVPPSPSAG